MTRRRWWRRSLGAAGVAALALALWSLWWEPAGFDVEEERIELPWSLRSPIRVAVLSDLHVGSPFNTLDKLRKIVDRTNAANPDVVCLLGDFVIHEVAGGSFVPPEAIAPELARLRAPFGVFSVLGNHDAWLNRDRVAAALVKNGLRLMDDEAEKIETPAGTVWIVGVSDLWTGKHDVTGALSAVPATAPAIVMTHNPDVFPRVPDRVSLTLAGHTHGGQVRLPFFGRPIVPSSFGERYAAGHIVEGGRHLFVTTGLGTSIFPIRFRVRPSVAMLTLTSEAR